MKVFGIVGWKNSGKTGLVERLVAEITGRGFTVSTIKHAHHSFDVDHEGRDSWRHRQAGAKQVLLSSRNRWALMHEHCGDEEASYASLLSKLDPVDVVLVEGFKAEGFPKIEAHRRETGQPLIARTNESVLAVAADHRPEEIKQPIFDLNDATGIADFILQHLGIGGAPGSKDGSGERHALPKGVDWTPVDEVHAALEQRFQCVVGTEDVGLNDAVGRIAASDTHALRPSPPRANSAVDGYGFARDTIGAPPVTLPLVEGRSEPGIMLPEAVPAGQAVRILTGAPLPEGVDTVALQENAQIADADVHFAELPRKGGNTRKAGEDLGVGDLVLKAKRTLRAGDAALLASAGLRVVSVRQKLRVGILSTGNELSDAGTPLEAAGIYDANRPMLNGLVRAFGCTPVDLGISKDSRSEISAALDEGAYSADVILTSGGASAGDEDHIADLLRAEGNLDVWRIAVKPGRPLAIGQWKSKPVFGLPGNPVAAFVCTLIFARPAILAMAGAGWQRPQPLMLPADFYKSKKPGRREYLRGRLTDAGRVEVFSSEGSGRVSGLSWAEGLVELPDGAMEIEPGTPVAYLPFSAFGIGSV